MHEHGPDCLEGPVRGSPSWWRGMKQASEKTTPPPEAPPPEAPPPEIPPPEIPAAEPDNKSKKGTKKKKETAIRKDLVERVRREIEAGTYDTPDKWHAALDRLLDNMEQDAQ